MTVESLATTSFVEAPADKLMAGVFRFMGSVGLRTHPYFRVTIVEAHNAEAARRKYGISDSRVTGRYYHGPRPAALVLEKNMPSRPITARTAVVAGAIHESTHNAILEGDGTYFPDEAMAGLAELGWLTRRRAGGIIHTARDYQPQPDGQTPDFGLTIPGECRYLDAREDTKKAADRHHTSSGLIAALGLAYGLEVSGITPRDIIRAGQIKPTAAHSLMRHALDAVHPDLWGNYAKLPRNIDGLLEGTAMVQQVAEARGILPNIGSLYAI